MCRLDSPGPFSYYGSMPNARSFFDIENQIEIAVNDGKSINLISYSFSEDVEKKLNSVITKILQRYGREEMAGIVYTMIKELAINGTKANIKYLFLEENGFDLADEARYQAGMQAFKQRLSEDFLLRMGMRARDKGLWVRINFQYDEHGMRILIRNNKILSAVDERRIRDKLSKAMNYSDIAQFYMDNLDESEGAGMGIALVIILLKAEGMDPGLFRVYSLPRDGETIARVEIPFSPNYVSLREKSRQGS